MVDSLLITTASSLEGYRVIKQLGLIRGIAVYITGGKQIIFGGKLSDYIVLCEKGRQDACNHMIENANAAGANAIICTRYDSNDLMQGIIEVLAYGTAVVVEKI